MAIKATILTFGLQAETDRTIYATWKWDDKNTLNYTIRWWYYTADGTMLLGSESTVTTKSSSYTAPSNATQVVFFVKPESKARVVNGVETVYWTADWSTASRYYFENNPAPVPDVPTVSIKDGKLTAYLNNLDELTVGIQFEIHSIWHYSGPSSGTSVTKNGNTKDGQTRIIYVVETGKQYRVRARAWNKHGVYSGWSDYSEPVYSAPQPPKEIIELKALSETSVYVEWDYVAIATGYKIEYTTDKTYFDSGTSGVQSVTVDSTVTHAEIIGLTSGEEYFFRVQASNEHGNSTWSEIKSIKIGKKPAAPTTWSSTTKVVTGEPVTFYWVHNTEDGSSQTHAEIELTLGTLTVTFTVKNSEVEDEKDRTSSYTYNNTTDLTEDSQILWRVRTCGITGVYGDWSTQRTIDVHSPVVLSLWVVDSAGRNLVDVITQFPFYVYGVAGTLKHKPVGYNVTVIANESYESVDDVGNFKMVNAGEQVYSKHFNTDDRLLVEFTPGNINLSNNITYTFMCTVAMNSGLTATESVTFRIEWTDDLYTPNAEIAVDKDNAAVYIRPYCEHTGDGLSTPELVVGVTLSVYRREFDGSFTEIATGLKNTERAFVTDPHPSLDYARYRIVAVTDATGAISYYDMPGYPIGEKAVIIQWDEEWSNFNTEEENKLVQPAWSGSLLRLPYNIDTSESYGKDVSLIKYTGRKHPVSYYGTQLTTNPTWNVEIDKDDKETIYALRRLSIYTGDVYVREPSGVGYWANIAVSFSQKHRELTIPVTLSITRVEGGV